MNAGFGIIVFNQSMLPSVLSEYSASIFLFYATIVYIVATTFRAAFVPKSESIFIYDSINTEDVLMIC